MSKETYKQHFKKLENYINTKDQKEFRKKKEQIIEGFKTFDIKEDLKNLHRIMIHEYTKNTIYSDLNRWLKMFDTSIYEIIAYFTARLMYALNSHAKESNGFFEKKQTLFRGDKVNYFNLLPYERLKGKIIILPSFTSTSEELSVAERFN